jgi:sulfide:quinone oxidoreductase
MRVLVLGAGFGGLELTSRLAEEFDGELEITLIDKTDAFVFGFSKLDVMFGRSSGPSVQHHYSEIVKPGVKFVQTAITSIDPVAKRVETEQGTFGGDYIVIALGADLDPSATPGLIEGGHEFYTEAGAFATADVLQAFGGGRVVIGVVSAPFKCPPAPSEAALLTDDLLKEKGVRDESSIQIVMPFGRPIPPSPDASAALLEAFGERDIEFKAQTAIARLDPERRLAITKEGEEIPYDLFLGVPHHVAPKVVVESGLTEDGWIPVDSLTLATKYPGIYAVGDVAAVGTPRAVYDGHGICYIEFGEDQIGMVDVTFFGDSKVGKLIGPGVEYVAHKKAFGTSRVKRWFGKDWTA